MWGVALLARLAGVGAITAQMQLVLDEHNQYRCMHGLQLYTWDDALAANAQAWADKGNYAHSSNTARVINGVQCGENIAWGYPSLSGVDSTDDWYSEIQYTRGGLADSFTDSTDPTQQIGHYTQIVWKDSNRLGCGVGKATLNGHSGDFWVCQYGPAGNYVGRFTTQVVAPVKTAAQCSGTSAGGGGTTTSPSPGTTTTPSPLPSACTPNVPLPRGALCVYGYQCASKFCCPRVRICMNSPSDGVPSTEIKVVASSSSKVLSIIINGTCSNPWANGQQCLQTGDGQPLKTWNQAVCGCNPDYMAWYNSGTWVTMNDIPGLVCSNGGNGSSLVSFATSSLAPRWALKVLFLASALIWA